MLKALSSTRATAWFLFAGLLFSYQALSPSTIAGRGYMPGDLESGLGVLASFNAWVKGRPVPPISWTRHGPITLMLDLPFIKIGKLFISPDFVMSLQAVLLTAGMLTILYLWLRKLCTPGLSLLITFSGAFCTMLWPYAYIGLEAKQSFFILLAGYLALGRGPIRSWGGALLFAAAAALAITVKSTGLILVPVIAYLIYAQFRTDWRDRWKYAAAATGIPLVLYVVGAIGWSYFWTPAGGAATKLQEWMVQSSFQVFSNFIGLLGSPTKGLFVFAPATLLMVYAIPAAWRRHRDIAAFAILVTVCTMAFISILWPPTDELWGPRFLHIIVAPLLLVIGAGWPRFNWRPHAPLILLSVIGLAISFLGAFYYYGARGWAAETAGQNTLEWYSGDAVWNEIVFDARLFQVWLTPGKEPVPWTPDHHWAWQAPEGAPEWKTLNLRDYADPQSFMLYFWTIPLDGSNLLIFRICLFSLFAGPPLLFIAIGNSMRSIWSRKAGPDESLHND